MLTAVGEAQCSRPYYLCERCHHGQFPVDIELDIQDTELSPGVRRMMAAVGHEAAFDRGREQLKLLAGLSVTTKTVERTAEAIGADIERRQQQERKQAMQLELPIPLVPLVLAFCSDSSSTRRADVLSLSIERIHGFSTRGRRLSLARWLNCSARWWR